jgi:hypothetical protein
MHTMEQDLNRLLTDRAITWDDASNAANQMEYLKRPGHALEL